MTNSKESENNETPNSNSTGVRKRSRKAPKKKSSTANKEEEEMKRQLQLQKRQLKEANYQMFLQRMEKAEEERLDKKLFHRCYENSEYVRQVRMYK